MRGCTFNVICNIVMNTLKYGVRFFKFVKIDVISVSADVCLDIGIEGNEHPPGKFGSAFPFLSFRP